MDLLLWRHATAEDVAASDLERALTKRGLAQAERIAHWLKTRLPREARILVSPALRTRETVEALTKHYEVVEALAPGASPEAVLREARWPNARGPVLIVGHQPTLGAVAARVLTGRDQGWSVRKGALWWLSHRDRDEGNADVLRAVVDPDLL